MRYIQTCLYTHVRNASRREAKQTISEMRLIHPTTKTRIATSHRHAIGREGEQDRDGAAKTKKKTVLGSAARLPPRDSCIPTYGSQQKTQTTAKNDKAKVSATGGSGPRPQRPVLPVRPGIRSPNPPAPAPLPLRGGGVGWVGCWVGRSVFKDRQHCRKKHSSKTLL